MKLIAYVAAFNEADYIEQSIRSTINHVDRMIVIEGAFGETIISVGKLYSDDGTIEILQELQKEFSNLEVYYHNEKNQLFQRTKVFDYINEECYMLIQDGDEVWDEDNIKKLKELINKDEIEGARFQSWTFVNDFYNVLPIPFPRLFRLHKDKKYVFAGANNIGEGKRLLKTTEQLDIKFFHYAYVKSPARFIEKKKERTKFHGQFKWELRDGLVQHDKTNVQPFCGLHPEIMKGHPMAGIRRHKKIKAPEIIVMMQHSGIGNLILTTPCLKALRELKPNAHIYVVTWPRSARILEGLDCVDNVISTDNKKFLHSLERKIDHLLLSPVGAAVDNEILSLSQNTMKHPITPPWGKHEVEVGMDFARKLGYRGPTPHTEIKIFNYNHVKAAAFLDKNKVSDSFICISAAYLKSDHWFLKHYGNNNYTELLNQLIEICPNIVFIGAESDFEDAKKIIGNHNVINACGFSGDIKDTAALISRSRLVVGNDGGLLHVSAALDVPTVAIFTFTSPIKNAPIGKNSKVIMNFCPNRTMCQHGNYKQCKKKICLEIPVNKVLDVVSKILKGQ